MDLTSRLLLMGAAGVSSHWIATLSGASTELAEKIALDSKKNIYIAGYTNSEGAGSYDIYLAKYDKTGALVWQRLLGLSSDDSGYGIGVDSNDNIYVCGFGTPSTSGALLAKYNSNGVIQWQRILSAAGIELAYGLTIDSADYVYIAGYTTSQGAGGYDCLIAKYSSAGTIQWQRSLGANTGSITDIATAIVVDPSFNVYVGGYTYSQGSGAADFLIAKYDSSGVIQWQRILGGSGTELTYAIAVDSYGDLYVCGILDSQGQGNYDVSIQKYSSGGGIYWQRSLGGANIDYGLDIAVDLFSNIYITGSTASQGAGSDDVLIAKYDRTGTIQWQRILGTSSSNAGYGITVDAQLNVYICGISGSDILIAKLPGDGSKTGTYGSFTYQASTLTDGVTTLNFYASSLTDAATTLTDAAGTLTDAAGTLTSTRITV